MVLTSIDGYWQTDIKTVLVTHQILWHYEDLTSLAPTLLVLPSMNGGKEMEKTKQTSHKRHYKMLR